MAVSNPMFTIPGLTADVTQISNQYTICQLTSTAGTIKIATSATSKVVGVLINDPAAGEAAQVQVMGVAKVLAETSVTIGGIVCSSSTGRAKLTTTGGDRIIGLALDASSSAGDLIRVLLSISVNGD